MKYFINCHTERSQQSAVCRGAQNSGFLVASAPRNAKGWVSVSRLETA